VRDRPAGANREHSGLCANAAQFGARRVRAQPRQELVANVAVDRHGLGVDLQDVRPSFQIRQTELDLAIKTAGPQQSRV
jgi:hypothetical protein